MMKFRTTAPHDRAEKSRENRDRQSAERCAYRQAGKRPDRGADDKDNQQAR